MFGGRACAIHRGMHALCSTRTSLGARTSSCIGLKRDLILGAQVTRATSELAFSRRECLGALQAAAAVNLPSPVQRRTVQRQVRQNACTEHDTSAPAQVGLLEIALLLMQAFSTMAHYSQEDLGKYAYVIVRPLSSKPCFGGHLSISW